MFGVSWRVARIAGIEVRVDSSWVVIALLITYSMYLRVPTCTRTCQAAERSDGRPGDGAVLWVGPGPRVGPALVSQARGIRVQDITLFLFGGATRARVESAAPATSS